MVLPAHAETPAANAPKSKPIHIAADKLVTYSSTRLAEFIGNVRATQNGTVIIADRMKVFYQSGPAQEGTDNTAGAQSVRKIIAEGNVKITLEDRMAISSQAVYTPADRILVLSGSGSKLISGENTISGQKITLNRANGSITVERGKEKRVEAVIFSEDGDLQ
jgi:lipopolysaccharide export system protein LptA